MATTRPSAHVKLPDGEVVLSLEEAARTYGVTVAWLLDEDTWTGKLTTGEIRGRVVDGEPMVVESSLARFMAARSEEHAGRPDPAAEALPMRPSGLLPGSWVRGV